MDTEQIEENKEETRHTVSEVIRELGRRISTTNSTVRDIKRFVGKRYTRLSEKIRTLQTNKDIDELRISTLEEERESLENRIQDLETKVVNQFVDITRITNTNSALIRQISTLHSHIQNLNDQVRLLADRIEVPVEEELGQEQVEENQEAPERLNIIPD